MKKLIIILSLVFITLLSNATTYYVATNGSNANNGTSINSPWLDIQYGVSRIGAGDILYIRGGTYRSTYGNSAAAHLYIENLNGTSSSHVVISAYPGEVPVFNLSNITTNQSACFVIINRSCSYLDIKGLVITGILQPPADPAHGLPEAPNIAGFYTTSSNHITIENCVAHDMGGYGFTCNNSTYVTYKNCDAYYCIDPNSSNSGVFAPFENANGFGVTGGASANTSDNIIFDGCRAWRNADDGWDLYGVDSYITLKNCWSFYNGYKDDGSPMGNGQGFKLGPGYTGTSYNSTVRRIITNCIAAGNKHHGFDQNWGSGWGTCRMNFYNNLAFDNAQMGWEFSYISGIGNIFRNNAAFNNRAGTVQVHLATSTSDHNTWDGGITVNTGDFSSVTISQLSGTRKTDGSLPDITFGHLLSSSDLIDAGIDVGLPFNGSAPDMGVFETNSTGGGGTINLTVTGQNLTSTYNTLHTSQTNFVFTNNNLSTGPTSGYMLNSGDEAYSSTLNNKLDGQVITGNYIHWTGSPATDYPTHGIFVGFNINNDIRYNYVFNSPYGVVLKSGSAGSSMTNTTNGVAYNIFKDCMIGVIVRGINGAKIYNNTFYQSFAPYPVSQGAIIYVQENDSPEGGNAPSTGTKIKNNIIYTTQYGIISINLEDASCTSGFESDYNIFYCSSGTPLFAYNGNVLTFAQWQVLGYDTHSLVVNPNFNNVTDFVPAVRINGTDLTSTWQTGLTTTSTWVTGSTPATTNQNGTWQIGARIYGTSGSIPTVTTGSLSNIHGTILNGGGNVTNDGGATVIEKGICWDIITNPTISNNKTSDGTGVGSFTSSVTGLISTTRYYFRAYATNSTGTGYGSVVSGKTLSQFIMHNGKHKKHNGKYLMK
jgi:hypothetical protein